MKPSKTTLAGSSAAGFYAAAQIPGLPEWLMLSFKAGAALSMAALGWHSSDCPANCPGTDANGTRLPSRPVRFASVLPITLAAGIISIAAGCTTANPHAGQGDPPAPAYVPAPAITTWSNTVTPIAGTVGAVSGTGPALPTAVAGIFGLVAAISTLVAQRRSATANTLAAAIHDQGPQAVADAMAYASDSKHYGAVAAELNKHTATGQAPGQPTPAPDKKSG